MEVRLAVLWSLLVIASVANLAMLLTLWRARRAAALRRALPNGAVELAWAIVPWLITAFCAAPAVHHVLAAGHRASELADATAIVAQTSLARQSREDAAQRPSARPIQGF